MPDFLQKVTHWTFQTLIHKCINITDAKQAACPVMSVVVLSCTVAPKALWEKSFKRGRFFRFFFHHVVSHAYFRQLLFVNTVWTFAVRIFPGVLYVCTWLAIPVRCFDNRQSLGECRATCRNRKAGRYFQNSAWHHVTLAILQPECRAKTLALFTRHIGARKIIKWVVEPLAMFSNTTMCL